MFGSANGNIAALSTHHSHTHFTVLLDQLGNLFAQVDVLKNVIGSNAQTIEYLTQQITQQAQVLATADIYRIMAVIAAMLIVTIPLIPERVIPAQKALQKNIADRVNARNSSGEIL